MELFEQLNDAQKQAVSSTEGFVRVIAGAGSDKTRALSYRFAYLVNELGILPGHILCVTFTNKSANEMRQRIHRRIYQCIKTCRFQITAVYERQPGINLMADALLRPAGMDCQNRIGRHLRTGPAGRRNCNNREVP